MSININHRHHGDSVVGRFCLGLILVLCLMALFSPHANAGETSANYYGYQSVKQAQQVLTGEVLSVREVTINTSTGRGQVVAMGIGAASGAIVGSAISRSNSSARYAAGAIGTVIGGLVGHVAGNAVATSSGLEAIIRFENGQTMAFTQEADVPLFRGQQVYVIGSGGNVRVVPMANMR